MRKAIIHRNPDEPGYIEITECEEHDVKRIALLLQEFGDHIVMIINAADLPRVEQVLKDSGGEER